MWDFVGWFIANIGNWLLLFLSIATILTPMIIYLLERSRTPKLKFKGFLKLDNPEGINTKTQGDGTGYFIEIINSNKRSEGNADLCRGFITLGNRTHTTLWEYGHAGNTFARKALLFLFYVEKNDKTIEFVNWQQSRQNIESKPYDERIHDSITIGIECSRGHCPKPLTENIQNIINSATDV